jgi:hypothetical protein
MIFVEPSSRFHLLSEHDLKIMRWPPDKGVNFGLDCPAPMPIAAE